MTEDVREAVMILASLHKLAWFDAHMDVNSRNIAMDKITSAIRHLVYPDRDTYPKTRKGTKGTPIVRR